MPAWLAQTTASRCCSSCYRTASRRSRKASGRSTPALSRLLRPSRPLRMAPSSRPFTVPRLPGLRSSNPHFQLHRSRLHQRLPPQHQPLQPPRSHLAQHLSPLPPRRRMSLFLPSPRGLHPQSPWHAPPPMPPPLPPHPPRRPLPQRLLPLRGRPVPCLLSPRPHPRLQPVRLARIPPRPGSTPSRYLVMLPAGQPRHARPSQMRSRAPIPQLMLPSLARILRSLKVRLALISTRLIHSLPSTSISLTRAPTTKGASQTLLACCRRCTLAAIPTQPFATTTPRPPSHTAHSSSATATTTCAGIWPRCPRPSSRPRTRSTWRTCCSQPAAPRRPCGPSCACAPRA
eukprot:m.124982 g.124982  ORF g.124982 m.124982 type:complete len:344 (-) comp9362_c0_seq5:112-1143(-)